MAEASDDDDASSVSLSDLTRARSLTPSRSLPRALAPHL
jgi:hypothetical protein